MINLKQVVLLTLFVASVPSVHAQMPQQIDKPVGNLEVVVSLSSGPMPTGVTVSHKGRIFLNFPEWGDQVVSAVEEWKGGVAVPYPSNFPKSGDPDPADKLVGVQSVVVDQKDNLWILDTGSKNFGPSEYGGPKLVEVDLKTDQVVRKILLPREVAPATSFVNDVRFDYTHGTAGYALLTDTSSVSNAIIVVDLATGNSWRHLQDHPSTKPEPGFQPYVEGEALLVRPANGPASKPHFGSDGIAISGDYTVLYYCPLMGRHIYSVPLSLLESQNASETQIAQAVKDLGDKGMSDGLESDAEGRVYGGDVETNSVRRRLPNGSFELIAHDPRILWPDTLCLADDGYLYFTANQLNRQAVFHQGRDQRQYPYVVFRVKVDGTRIK